MDAIGALGIARCFIYSGHKKSPLYIPGENVRGTLTKEEYMASPSNSSIAHFYEKLLKLKDMMKTKTGKKMAEKRHAFMEAYLEQFYKEWDAEL